jgi:hypothetical protein
MFQYSLRALCAALLGALSIISPAIADEADQADEVGYPYLSGEIVVEIQNDWTYRSDDTDTELNSLSTKTEPVLEAHILPGLSVLAHAVIETVADPAPRDDRFFEDQGLFLEDLFIRYDNGLFFVQGGKFTPNFGLAWDAAPGIYGTDFAEAGYEFAERIGLGAGIKLAHEELGTHGLSASTFFVDTSALAGSAFTSRPRPRLGDGGVGNTGDLASFAIALDGGEAAIAPGLAYHLAFIRQASGAGDASDETGFAAALSYSFPIGEIELQPFVEHVRFVDADGVVGQDRHFLTASLQATWGDWNLAVSRTGRVTEPPGAADIDDELIQVSAGYDIGFGFTLDVGWAHTEEGGVDTAILGALLVWSAEF